MSLRSVGQCFDTTRALSDAGHSRRGGHPQRRYTTFTGVSMPARSAKAPAPICELGSTVRRRRCWVASEQVERKRRMGARHPRSRSRVSSLEWTRNQSGSKSNRNDGIVEQVGGFSSGEKIGRNTPAAVPMGRHEAKGSPPIPGEPHFASRRYRARHRALAGALVARDASFRPFLRRADRPQQHRRGTRRRRGRHTRALEGEANE